MIQEQGNTVGSRSQVDLAYIAGFLDGDGSLMIQLKRRSESKIKTRRIMLTICFYQDSRHEKPLHRIKEVLLFSQKTMQQDENDPKKNYDQF
jgi:LAGLIDADG endonuclease